MPYRIILLEMNVLLRNIISYPLKTCTGRPLSSSIFHIQNCNFHKHNASPPSNRCFIRRPTKLRNLKFHCQYPSWNFSVSINFSTCTKHCNKKELQSKNDVGNDKKAAKEWENLLGATEKQNNISSIPTVRENVFTIPNALSLSRIIMTPYIAHLVVIGQFQWALGLFVVAGITDMLDGQIARTWPSQQSAVGTALDPLGDKILVTALTLSLTAAGIMPAPLTAIIVGRDVALVLAVFYLRYRTCPHPVTLKRYFDPTLVNTKLNPTFISKVNTSIQMMTITASMCAPVWNFTDHVLLQSLYGLTAVTTLWSGASYIFSKDTVRILKDDEKT